MGEADEVTRSSARRRQPQRPSPVLHVGPSPDGIGGIAAVIRLFVVAGGPRRPEGVPSWAPEDRFWGVLRVPQVAAAICWHALRHRTIVHVHLSERGSFLREGAYALLARALRARTVVTVHGADFHDDLRRHSRLVVALLQRMDCVVVLSVEHADLLTAAGVKATRVSNAVSPGRRAPYLGRNVDFVFGGECSRRKGFDVLQEAWSHVVRESPHAKLVVLGPAGDVPVTELPGLAHRGPVPPHDVREALAGARWAVLPSRREVLPMFLIEAMSEGTPWISTAVAGVPDLAEEGGGVLIPPDDAPALAQAMLAALRDGAGRSLALRSREAWEAHHAPARVLAQYEAVYRRVESLRRGDRRGTGGG